MTIDNLELLGETAFAMRKLSERQRRRLIDHAARSNRRRIVSLAKAKARRGGTAPGYFSRASGRSRIAAPADFSLTSNYDGVSRFFDDLREAVGGPNHRFGVDFTTIRRLAPAAALMLAAHLDLWQRVRKVRLWAIDAHRWRPEVRRMLVELGLFDLLKTRNAPRVDPQKPAGEVKILKFCSGEGSDGSLAQALTKAMIEIAGAIEAHRFLYVGLTEAMTNVAQHAYTEAGWEDIPPNYKRWWMTGAYDGDQHSMRVMILDIGVGIPATLPRWQNWPRVLSLLEKLSVKSDADMIAAAVEIGKSSTGMAGRGYGLDEIRQFVENSDTGRLRILSGCGEVLYEKGCETPRKRDLSSPLGGTLIEWEVFRGVA